MTHFIGVDELIHLKGRREVLAIKLREVKNVNKEPEWLPRVRETHKYHVSKLRENPKHTIRETANHFKRAIGPVSEELKVASWLRSHGPTLEEFEYFHEAIEFIRQRKHKLLTEE